MHNIPLECGGHFVRIIVGGWGKPLALSSNWEIVSPRAHARTHARSMRREGLGGSIWGQNVVAAVRCCPSVRTPPRGICFRFLLRGEFALDSEINFARVPAHRCPSLPVCSHSSLPESLPVCLPVCSHLSLPESLPVCLPLNSPLNLPIYCL